jgi:hypothetical protein
LILLIVQNKGNTLDKEARAFAKYPDYTPTSEDHIPEDVMDTEAFAFIY